jgi:hypothetical protein
MTAVLKGKAELVNRNCIATLTLLCPGKARHFHNSS